MKKCSKCKQNKDLCHFHKNKSRKDGFHHTCKLCSSVVQKNKDRKQSSRKYYIKNKEEILAKHKIYRDSNKHKICTRDLDYKKRRYENDPQYRAITNARLRVSGFLRNKEKFSKSLGCSFNDFKQHIESLFQPGMTWENYGEWHIDHKYPLSMAYLKGEHFFKKACHYSNLQPLWAIDNLKKAANVNSQSLNNNLEV